MNVFEDKALNKGFRRQSFLTRLLGDFGHSLRSRFSLCSFDSRFPILSKDKKDKQKMRK